jgi:hypothetical protein
MSKPKIGIIVDGQGDFSSLQARFKDKFRILKTDGPRGHNAKPEEIISKSRKQINILRNFKCTKAIVLLDFEERGIRHGLFVQKLIAEIKNAQFPINVAVVVPNKMIENWYLADINFLSKRKKFLKNNIKQKPFEGKHGKKELKKCFVKKFSYNEVIHGPQLFKIIRNTFARKNSSSYDQFLLQINSFK